MKKFLAVLFIILVLVGGAFALHRYVFVAKPAPAKTVAASTPAKTSTKTKPAGDGFNKDQYSHTDPTSIWVMVNKKNPLNPKDYVPSDLVVPNVPLRVPGNQTMQLRKVTANAMEQMFAAAKAQGLDFMLASGYRSYSYQLSLYNGYVQTQGQAVADQQSARPGYSEHQTGLAADVEPASRNCEVEQCFATTPEGIWLAANSYKYGFIIRYPKNGASITGYEYEPWHIRYIGVAAATEMHKQGVTTLEQFFGYPPAPNY